MVGDEAKPPGMGDDKSKDDKSKQGGGFGNLFGGKKEEKSKGPDITEFLEHVKSIDRRLRTLESRYNDLNRKIQFMDKNFTAEKKRIFEDIKAADEINLEQKKDLSKIGDTQKRIISEFKNFAPIEELTSLKKYIELWEPVNFVTRKEVMEIVDEAVRERLSKHKK